MSPTIRASSLDDTGPYQLQTLYTDTHCFRLCSTGGISVSRTHLSNHHIRLINLLCRKNNCLYTRMEAFQVCEKLKKILEREGTKNSITEFSYPLCAIFDKEILTAFKDECFTKTNLSHIPGYVEYSNVVVGLYLEHMIFNCASQLVKEKVESMCRILEFSIYDVRLVALGHLFEICMRKETDENDVLNSEILLEKLLARATGHEEGEEHFECLVKVKISKFSILIIMRKITVNHILFSSVLFFAIFTRFIVFQI